MCSITQPVGGALLGKRRVFQPAERICCGGYWRANLFSHNRRGAFRIFPELIDFLLVHAQEGGDRFWILFRKGFAYDVVVVDQIAVFLQIFGRKDLMPSRCLQLLGKWRPDVASINIATFPGRHHLSRTQRQQRNFAAIQLVHANCGFKGVLRR